MKKLSKIASAVMMIIGMTGIAYADKNTWTGFYAGVDAGLVFNNAQLKSQQLAFTIPSDTCNTSSDYSSFTPGVQLGYMYQFSNHLVSGIEANVSVNANQKNTLSCTSNISSDVYDRFSFRNQMQSSIKARLGRALSWNKNMFLPYLTVGGSLASVGLTYQNEGGDYYSKSMTHTGWLIGAGVEWAFRQHWSVRAEYYYLDYGDTIRLNLPSVYDLIDPNGNGRVSFSSNNVVVAVNYWV